MSLYQGEKQAPGHTGITLSAAAQSQSLRQYSLKLPYYSSLTLVSLYSTSAMSLPAGALGLDRYLCLAELQACMYIPETCVFVHVFAFYAVIEQVDCVANHAYWQAWYFDPFACSPPNQSLHLLQTFRHVNQLVATRQVRNLSSDSYAVETHVKQDKFVLTAMKWLGELG